ncbi:MAG: hypothetical protein K8R21_04985 [Leptospira sp.]|nr:hypothetical protein [Leptospira sp.]
MTKNKSGSSIHAKDFKVLIDAYRESLKRRYSEKNLSRFPEFSAISISTVNKLVNYFLEFLYPPYEERLKLDNAFESLASFVHKPSKFLGIIGNLGAAIFRFGKHFPAAIRSGIAALSSYLTAHRFENVLFENARPYIEKGENISDETEFNRLIGMIPRHEAEKFRRDIIELFRTLSKKEVLVKIIEIMDDIITRMKEKKNTYTENEISGIEMGLFILKRGTAIFDELDEAQIRLILHAIDEIEKEFFETAVSHSILS